MLARFELGNVLIVTQQICRNCPGCPAGLLSAVIKNYITMHVIKEHPTLYLKYLQSSILTLFIENVFISVGSFHGI